MTLADYVLKGEKIKKRICPLGKSDKNFICENVNRPVGGKGGHYGILPAMRRKAKQNINKINY